MAKQKTLQIPSKLADKILPIRFLGVIEVDAEGIVQFWSTGLLEEWDIQSEEMLEKELLIQPIFAEMPFPQLFTQAIQNKLPQPFLIQAENSHRRTITAHHGILYPLYNDNSEYEGMAVAFHRTTPPRQRELPDSLFRQSFEGSNDAVSITDINGKILDVNDAFVRLYGYSRDELIGENHRIIKAVKADDKVYQEMWRDILDPSIGHWKGELTNFRRDDTPIDVLLSITPIRNAEGNIEGYMGIAIDLSKQKRMEAKLRLSEEKYRSIIRNAHEGIAIREGMQLIEVNESFATLAGCSVDDCYGLDLSTLLTEESAAVYTTAVVKRARLGEVVQPQFNVTLTNLRGERRIWHVHERRLPYRERTVAMIVQDITEDRNQAERLIQQEKLAAIGLLTAGVAHEIGNPLASLSGLIQVWAMEQIDTPSRQRLGDMDRNITRISSVVEQMLDFAKPRNLEWQLCDVHTVILDAIQIASYDRRMRQISISRKFMEGLPETYAMVEGLRQVFVNLIINAIDAMGKGGQLEIATRLSRSRVQIEFKDSGEGMPDDVRRRAFEPFFTTKQVGKGTGMGLAVSYSLIEKHGGSITIESETGKGTSVVVTVPHRDEIVEGID